jgi:hypothetical protein
MKPVDQLRLWRLSVAYRLAHLPKDPFQEMHEAVSILMAHQVKRGYN